MYLVIAEGDIFRVRNYKQVEDGEKKKRKGVRGRIRGRGRERESKGDEGVYIDGIIIATGDCSRLVYAKRFLYSFQPDEINGQLSGDVVRVLVIELLTLVIFFIKPFFPRVLTRIALLNYFSLSLRYFILFFHFVTDFLRMAKINPREILSMSIMYICLGMLRCASISSSGNYRDIGSVFL